MNNLIMLCQLRDALHFLKLVKIDCLIKSGYKKTNSCLTHETLTNGKDTVEIRVGGCIVYEINGFYLDD